MDLCNAGAAAYYAPNTDVGKGMLARRTGNGLLSNRILRLQTIGLWRAIADQIVTVRDGMVSAGVAIAAGILLLATWAKLWSVDPSRTYFAGVLVSAAIAATVARRLRHRRSWMGEHGILSPDALCAETWIPFEIAGQVAAALCAWLPVVVLTAHLSGWPVATFAASALLSLTASVAIVRLGKRPARTRARFQLASGPLAPRARLTQIALGRRLAPLPHGVHAFTAVLVAGLAAGCLPTGVAAAGAPTNGVVAAAFASVILPLLWLTRQDPDLNLGMALACVRPMHSARQALAPACAFAAGATCGLVTLTVTGNAPWALLVLPFASLTILSIVYVLRAWRTLRMTYRAADMLACGDLAIVILAGVMAQWLAGILALFLLWRLHRRATAELLIL